MPTAYKGYLVAKVLRSDRVVDTDQLWHDVGVPSLIGKKIDAIYILAKSYRLHGSFMVSRNLSSSK